MHRICGTGLVLAVAVHVVALWITSPPDVIDALLFVSPTPFSIWGVIALWAIFAAGFLAMLRSRIRLRLQTWRRWHIGLVVSAVITSVAHAMLIEGTMEPISKATLCALVLVAMIYVLKHEKYRGLMSPRYSKK